MKLDEVTTLPCGTEVELKSFWGEEYYTDKTEHVAVLTVFDHGNGGLDGTNSFGDVISLDTVDIGIRMKSIPHIIKLLESIYKTIVENGGEV